MKLSILEYMKYLGGSENSKCVVEGENVINAGHLILTGKTQESSEDIIFVYGLCLQSTSLDSVPHEISGKLSLGNSARIEKMLCSCKAGNSGRCKHVSALLIKCIRDDIEKFELVSSTDRKCVWSTQKHSTKEKYRPVPVDKMPCFAEKVKHSDIVVDDDGIRAFFCNKLPESAIAKHRMGRREVPMDVYPNTNRNVDISCHFFEEILNNACQSPLMMLLASISLPLQRNCCMELLANLNADDIEVVINIPQHSVDWRKMRKHRITGSRCYEIYTYSKDDWKTKSFKYFNPLPLNNKYVKHGLQFENHARDMFVKISNMNVVECGMIISEANKWLGYSPDGIIFFDGRPQYLLEIKCIFEGKTKTILEAVKKVTYIIEQNGQYVIKKHHKYYGQIQMGMAVLNLPKTYFIVFASYDNSLLIIEINFDFQFALSMLTKIKHNYFEKMLHEACED